MKNQITFLLLFILSHSASAEILKVGSGMRYNGINTAIAAAGTGDTIIVSQGIYKEKGIIVDKKITLIGEGYPVLDGEGKYEVLSVKANGVIVKGFTITHSGSSSLEDIAGIKIYNVRDVVISDNILDDTYFGIYSQYGTNCTIENNKITSYGQAELMSGNGIHCWKSDSMRIIGNTIKGHRDGIYFEFVTNSVIWRNISEKNIRYGLHFMFSNDDSYIMNVFENNGAGVAVMFSKHVKMFRNFFQENWGDAAYGLLLKEISDSYIEGNFFHKNTTAIFMEGASRISAIKNVFSDNGWGMKIQASCMDIAVNQNNFTGNTFDVATNGSLVLNNFDHNYWDKYEGYDINKDLSGDIPFHPVSMYSMIIETNPPAMILFRSFITSLLDKTEKILPILTPENLKDNFPVMKPYTL
ncbi:right-handed parallel beta-helix repeat-containing protein [soil metagenome]